MGEYVYHSGVPKLFFLVDGLLFDSEEDNNSPSLYIAQYLRFSRWIVPFQKKDSFMTFFEKSRQQRLKLDPHNGIHGSWVITSTSPEGNIEGVQEFIIFRGCDTARDAKKSRDNRVTEIDSSFEMSLKQIVNAFDIQNYIRVI